MRNFFNALHGIHFSSLTWRSSIGVKAFVNFHSTAGKNAALEYDLDDTMSDSLQQM